jgi:adenylylsulfate kinase
MADDIKSTNITWHHADVTRADREAKNGHKAVVLWFTGLSGSGKSTLAHAVENALFDLGGRTYVLDGDNIRHGLNKNLGFSPADREENIRRIGGGEVVHGSGRDCVDRVHLAVSRRSRQSARDSRRGGSSISM